MSNEGTEEQRDGATADAATSNASKVPPHEGGFEPVERREPTEDEEQLYTGHPVLDDSSLGTPPVLARGKAPS